jgi:hypothetical protein
VNEIIALLVSILLQLPFWLTIRFRFVPTAFWGEEEIQVVANMGPAKDLPNIWPTTGLFGFEMDGPWKAAIVGFTKLIAISFTVAGGLRGGKFFLRNVAGSRASAIFTRLPKCN